MNRKQRRAQAKVQNVDLRELVTPQQMTIEECATLFQIRANDNARITGHPFHHLTANGAIVTPDPTLEYFMMRLSTNADFAPYVEHLKATVASHYDNQPNLPAAIPVNRKHYGQDPYALQG